MRSGEDSQQRRGEHVFRDRCHGAGCARGYRVIGVAARRTDLDTPQSGSAERTAILDAVRRFHNTKDKYVVHEMLVQGDWALTTVSPESATESVVSYLALRREGGQWVDVVASDSGETEDWKAGYRDSWIEFGVPSTLVTAYQFKTP